MGTPRDRNVRSPDSNPRGVGDNHNKPQVHGVRGDSPRGVQPRAPSKARSSVGASAPSQDPQRDLFAVGEQLELVEVVTPRPRTRAECEKGPRPCPWVGCRHHLYLDVHINENSMPCHPTKEVWELTDTCSLDIAEDGGVSCERVGELLNLTSERIRQIEVPLLAQLRVHSDKGIEPCA